MTWSGGNVSLGRQTRQKPRHLRLTHLLRVTLAMKQDVALDPVDLGVLGPDAVVAHPYRLTHRVLER